MPAPMTPIVERTTLISPAGPDVVQIAALVANVKGVANRAEWASKALIDVKFAKSSVSDADHSNTSFAAVEGVTSTLNFTDVSVGDIIVLNAATSWALSAAEATNPALDLRWLVGAVDATVGGDGAYPRISPGTVLPANTAHWALTCLAVHTATAAGSLAAVLQNKCSVGTSLVLHHAQLVGVHFRLGAA